MMVLLHKEEGHAFIEHLYSFHWCTWFFSLSHSLVAVNFKVIKRVFYEWIFFVFGGKKKILWWKLFICFEDKFSSPIIKSKLPDCWPVIFYSWKDFILGATRLRVRGSCRACALNSMKMARPTICWHCWRSSVSVLLTISSPTHPTPQQCTSRSKFPAPPPCWRGSWSSTTKCAKQITSDGRQTTSHDFKVKF